MSSKDTITSTWEILPVTISGGTSVTDKIDLGGLRLFGLVLPSSWTAAGLTFQMSPDGGTTWANMSDQSGSEISALASASVCTMLEARQFAPIQYVKIRSGTSTSPVVQAADRSLQLILRIL